MALTIPQQQQNLPPRSVSSLQNYSTIGCSAYIIAPIWYSPLSNLTTANRVDTDVDIYDDSHYLKLL